MNLSDTVFMQKYAHEGCETWPLLCKTLATEVCGDLVPPDILQDLIHYMTEMKFIPGGRYLYYAGKQLKAYNNCFMLKAEEDTREDWADLSWKAESCLTLGGGIGSDYSVYRPRGTILRRTGGIASGPVSKMCMIDSIGQHVVQGGSRRSAMYASLNWKHQDIWEFIHAKDWHKVQVPGTDKTLADVKLLDFNWPVPLGMTNISVNYNTEWLGHEDIEPVFLENVKRALSSGEPGFSFNFFEHENETLRNACAELCSADDSDVCNLGSINLARIRDLTELNAVVYVATIFLLCGTLKADLPYEKVYRVREKNRRLGLGLMGIHEWMIQRGFKYEMNDTLRKWLGIYRGVSSDAAYGWASDLSISQPIATRAIAPTGTIGMLAGTTTGIEPLFAVAYKRRYLKAGRWYFQYAVERMAHEMMVRYGTQPETAMDLAVDYERRIKFQADVQEYVDHCIASTINLPAWGSEINNPDTVLDFARTLRRYAPRLRGFTCYPDGARGGQPLTVVPYEEAMKHKGIEFEDHEACVGGVCGV